MARTLPRIGIGEEVRRVRIASGLTLERFAARIGRNWSTVSTWETDGQMPSEAAMQAIRRAFGVYLGAYKWSAVELKTAIRERADADRS